jgi:GMP synthase PP-ATPase subunit
MKIVMISMILMLSSLFNGKLVSKIKTLKEIKEGRVRYLRDSIRKLKNNKLSEKKRKSIKNEIVQTFEGSNSFL